MAPEGGAPSPWVEHDGGDPSMPLAAAALRGDLEAVKQLAPPGMSFYAWFDRGWAALHWAAQGGSVDVVTFLLDMGAPPNHGTQLEGETAMHIAVRRGHTDTVRVLLDRGADPSIQTGKGETLGYFAIVSGRLDTLEVLAEYANDQVNEVIAGIRKEHPVVSMAIALSRPEAAMWLLEHGADASRSDKGGKAPVHYAAESGYPELVRFLVVDKGVSGDALTKDNWTPLHFAAERRQAEVISLLLELDAIIDPARPPTAMAVARKPGYSDMVRLLLDGFAYRSLVNGRFARPCSFGGSLPQMNQPIPRKLTSSMSLSMDEKVYHLGSKSMKRLFRLQYISGPHHDAPPCWALFAGDAERDAKWVTLSKVIEGARLYDDLNRYICLAPTKDEPEDVRVLRTDFHAESETVRYYFPLLSKKPEDGSLHPTDDFEWAPTGLNRGREEKPPFVYELRRIKRPRESSLTAGENAAAPRAPDGVIACITVDKKTLWRSWSFELRFLAHTMGRRADSLVIMTAWEVFLQLTSSTAAWLYVRKALGYDMREGQSTRSLGE